MDTQNKLVRIKRGYHGNGAEYQYGDKVFLIIRTFYSNSVFEKPNINAGDAIYREQRGDFYPFIRRFKKWLEHRTYSITS